MARPKAKKPALRSSSLTCACRRSRQRDGERSRSRSLDRSRRRSPRAVPTRRPELRRTWPVRSRAVPLHVEVRGSGPPLVMLHGFTQTGRLWGRFGEQLEAHRRLVCVDLPGHGGSDAVRADIPGTRRSRRGRRPRRGRRQQPWTSSVTLWAPVSPSISPSAAPWRSAGWSSSAERLAWRTTKPASGVDESDGELADRLEAAGDVAGFVKEWLRGPMFSGLPAAEAGQEERRRNTASGLASSLRLCGAGTQEAIWDRMATLRPSMLTVAGMDDTRYAAHAIRLARLAPRAVASLVPGGGHAVHLAQPKSATRLVLHWLHDTE